MPRKVPDDYYIEYEYFKDIEYREFREFFADENYFDDSGKYLELYKEYYRQEMEEFRNRFEKEMQSFEDYRYRELEEYYKYMKW